MRVVHATLDDMPAWLKLAAEVESLFGPMVDDPNFIRALENGIQRHTAFCIRAADGPPGTALRGGLSLVVKIAGLQNQLARGRL